MLTNRADPRQVMVVISIHKGGSTLDTPGSQNRRRWNISIHKGLTTLDEISIPDRWVVSISIHKGLTTLDSKNTAFLSKFKNTSHYFSCFKLYFKNFHNFQQISPTISQQNKVRISWHFHVRFLFAPKLPDTLIITSHQTLPSFHTQKTAQVFTT